MRYWALELLVFGFSCRVGRGSRAGYSYLTNLIRCGATLGGLL